MVMELALQKRYNNISHISSHGAAIALLRQHRLEQCQRVMSVVPCVVQPSSGNRELLAAKLELCLPLGARPAAEDGLGVEDEDARGWRGGG